MAALLLFVPQIDAFLPKVKLATQNELNNCVSVGQRLANKRCYLRGNFIKKQQFDPNLAIGNWIPHMFDPFEHALLIHPRVFL